MRLMRMRVKRFLIFILLLFVIASSYMYYTLFSTPHHDRSSLNSFVVHQEKAPVHEKQNESKDEDNRLDESEVLKLHPQGIQKRLRDGKERGEETDEEPDSPHEGSRSKRLKNLMLKQQKIIEKQAQLLERLHKQAEVAQGQAVPRKPEHLQDHHPARPLESRKDVHRETHEDSGMGMAGMHDQADSGRHEDNQAMKLAVNGIQPRRKPNLGKYNRNVENQRPHEMFERAHQMGRGNVHLPIAPPPEHGDDGDDEVGMAHEPVGKNPHGVEEAGAQPMLNRARQRGRGNAKQHPLVPQHLQDEVDGALGMFHESVRKNQDVMADNRKKQRAEAIQNKIKNRQNVDGMDAQQMFHNFVRNNPLQENGDENQLEVHNNPHPVDNDHRPRRSMGAGAGRRHIASYEPGASADGHDKQNGASDTHNKAQNVGLLREQRHKLEEQQNKTRFHEALKVLAQLGRVGKFSAEVKDLSVPVNGTAKCVPLRMRLLTRPICVYSTKVDTEMSRHLILTGTFPEQQELKEFHAALSTDDSLAAVDIGAALGVYSLLAAGKNRTVLAVEPLRDHQRLFTRTMQINKLTKQVTLVTNALGEKKQFGRIRSPHPSGNMGTVYVDPITKLTQVGNDVRTIVRMLPLDDLLPVVKFRSAVMKLDAQGDEEMVLRGAHRFFDQIDVRYVLMHWLPAFTRDSLNECLLFFAKRGYIPTASLSSNKTYSMQDLQKDINFIVWRKKGH